MKTVYVYENEKSDQKHMTLADHGEGYYTAHHEETGLAYGDSFCLLHSTWEVPDAYETAGGDVMVPYAGHMVPWAAMWPTMPKGANKIKQVEFA